jgi:hypothetical protein
MKFSFLELPFVECSNTREELLLLFAAALKLEGKQTEIHCLSTLSHLQLKIPASHAVSCIPLHKKKNQINQQTKK